jgi:hypothetical protein
LYNRKELQSKTISALLLLLLLLESICLVRRRL